MGYVARVGDIVKSKTHQYQIIREINKGCFADAYKARRDDGTMIFLKQYKSPSKLVPWFDKYFEYETELNKRLREDPVLKSATVYANEMFLARVYKEDGWTSWTRNECIFQAFPFITGNTHLGDMIEKGTKAFDWEKKVYACAVFAFALRKLHDADVVHCDLKPENVQVKLDSTIAIKYRPLLIDMDWSILSDKKARWHGKQGYVGTPGYTSPEHLRDEAPLEASDVFTASIIMFQVLAGRHPFASVLNTEHLNQAILDGAHDFKKFAEPIPFGGEVPDNLKNLLLDALQANPKKRPTIEAIHLELMAMCKELGKPKTSGHAKLPTKAELEATIAKPVHAKRSTRPHYDATKLASGTGSTSGKVLTIYGDAGSFSTKIGFVFDQSMLRRVTSSAKFADSVKQFELAVNSRGIWKINSNSEAPNYTCLNESILDEKFVPLKSGDVISLKGKASGKKAMDLKIEIA